MKTKTASFYLLLLLSIVTSLVALPMDRPGLDVPNDSLTRGRAGADPRAGDTCARDAGAGAGEGNVSQNTRSSTLNVGERKSDALPDASGQENSNIDDQPSLVGEALTLEDFRNALNANRDAERLIVVERDGAISVEPRTASANRFDRSRSENQDTIDFLRTLIPAGVADDLLAYRSPDASPMAMHIDPVTPARLQQIFERIDQATLPLLPRSPSSLLTLQHFKEAVTNPAHATAERLIIDSKTGTIRPWNKADKKIKEKNETIIAALKSALQGAFPRIAGEKIIEEELPPQSLLEKLKRKSSSLSTETLQRILARADDAMSAREFVEQTAFTLQHFRNALAHPENKEAQRLVISGEGVSARILAQAASANNASKNHSENKAMRETLKSAMEREGHHKNFVQALFSDLLPYSKLDWVRKIRPPLSFEKLTIILQRADDAMAEAKLLHATRSVVPLSSNATNRAAARKLFRNAIENFFNKLGVQNNALATNISETLIGKSAEEIAAQHAANAKQAALGKSEMEKFIRALLLRGRDPEVLKSHYAEAEAAAIAAEAAHNQAMEARWDAEKKEKYLAQARLFFEEVKAALDEKRAFAEFDESTLSKIAQGADLAGALLGMFNVPGFVNPQGIAAAISTFANFADQKLTIAEAQKAYNALQAAIQKGEAAIEGNEKVDESASAMHSHAEKIETLKKQEDHDETMRLSAMVKPPLDFADDTAWRKWSTDLACETDAVDENEAASTAYLLYKQGKKNPATLHEFISTTWNERLLLSQQLLQQLDEETSLEANNLQHLEYKSAREKEMETEADTTSAKARFDEAAQAKSEWLSKRDQLRQEKKSLEDQLLADAANREQWQLELNAKRSELGSHQIQKEAIDSAYQKSVEEAKSLTAIATAANAEAFEKFKVYDSAKNLQTRNNDRFRAAVEIDRGNFIEILIAEARRKEAHACKKQAESLAKQKIALVEGIKVAEKLHKQRAEEWRKVAVSAYRRAAEEQANGNMEAAEAICKEAQACKKKASVTAQNDKKAAELYAQRGWEWRNVVEAYIQAFEQQAKGNREAAEAYRKSAQAHEKYASALERGDKETTELHKEKVSAWNTAAYGYVEAAEEQHEGNNETAEAQHKCAQLYEAQAAALERGDKDAAELQQQKAYAWYENAVHGYRRAAAEQAKGNNEAANACRQKVQVWKEQLAAFERGDKETAELHKEKVSAWHNAAHGYVEAAEEQHEGNGETAEAWRKNAQSWEERAAALERGDKDAAELHQQKAHAWLDAVKTHFVADRMRAEGNNNVAESFRKKAQVYEAQAAALTQELKAHEEKRESMTTPPEEKKAPDPIPPKTIPRKKDNCIIS